jgi:hypothetical protein
MRAGDRRQCWIPNATDVDAEYAVLIVFPLQQRLHERASRYDGTYIPCLVSSVYLEGLEKVYSQVRGNGSRSASNTGVQSSWNYWTHSVSSLLIRLGCSGVIYGREFVYKRNRSKHVYAGQRTYHSAPRHLKAVNAVRFHVLDATGWKVFWFLKVNTIWQRCCVIVA